MTKTESLIQRLLGAGFKEVETRSSKNRAFAHSELTNLVFVSRRATIRFGKNISNSISFINQEGFLNKLENKFSPKTL